MVGKDSFCTLRFVGKFTNLDKFASKLEKVHQIWKMLVDLKSSSNLEKFHYFEKVHEFKRFKKSSQKRKNFINSRKVHEIEKRRKMAQKSKQAGI